MRALMTLGVVGALLLTAAGSFARSTAGTWNGTWDTEWGAMKLTARGTTLTGTYPHDDGRVSGTVAGGSFKGRWSEAPTRKGPGDAGAVEFTMSRDGKRLTGRWNYDGSPTSWHTDWNGSCSAGACLQNTSAPTGGTATTPGGGGGGTPTTPGGGGGGGGGTTTTTTPGGGAAAPATGDATGTVTVNGRPFTTGTIPYGATVDVTNGSLVLRTDTGTLTVTGIKGVVAAFRLLRGTDRKKPIVELRLVKGDFGACPKRKTKSARAAAPTVVRAIWGDGKGKFRTNGRYASATIRGTNWLTADRCDGTFVRVRQGVIEVNDRPDRRIVSVRAPRTYLATP